MHVNSGGGRGAGRGPNPAKKIFSNPSLETKSQKENFPCNVI